MRPSSETPVCASPRLRERLRTAPDAVLPVVHRGRHAVYVDLDGWCVGLVAAGATAVPNALRSRCPDLGAFPGRSAYLRGGVLHLDETPLVVGRAVDVSAPRLVRLGGSAHTAGSTTDQAIPPAPVVESAVCVGAPGLDAAAVERLVGRGDGLTPLGDDILCGWLATHRAAGVPTPAVDAAVRALMPRTTLLSATLLDCALHGEVLPQFAAYLSALGTSAEHRRTTDLEAVGHTSGAGLLYGARLALTDLRQSKGAAA